MSQAMKIKYDEIIANNIKRMTTAQHSTYTISTQIENENEREKKKSALKSTVHLNCVWWIKVKWFLGNL